MSKKRRRRRKKYRRSVWPIAVPAGLTVMLVILLTVFLWIREGERSAASVDGPAETVSGEMTGSGYGEEADAPDALGDGIASPDEKGGSEEKESGAVGMLSGDGPMDPSDQANAPSDSAGGQPEAPMAQLGGIDDAEDPQGGLSEDAGGAQTAFEDTYVPEGEATLGIDVSKYQGVIDWAAVKAAGVEFAMIRVGYRAKTTGVLYEDPGARYNLQEAAKNGIRIGVYFFSSAVSEQEAAEEAAWVAGLISRYPITYPVAYNCEDFQSPDSRQNALDKETRTKIACAFLDAVQRFGYTGMFYASRNEMEGSAQWDMSMLEDRCMVWVSQYPDQPYPQTASPDYSGKYAMWQYTSQGTVAGIRGKADLDLAWFGADWTPADPKDPTAPAPVAADPEVGLEFAEVNDLVTAKDSTNLRNIPTTVGSSVIHLLKNGEQVQRTGVGSNGWDRVIWEGQRLYAVHSYLTDELSGSAGENGGQTGESGPAGSGADGQTGENALSGSGGQEDSGTAGQGQSGSDTVQVGGMTFRTVSEAVTARDKVNLRDFPSTETGNVVGTLSYGEAVVRTGISGSSDTGWSRLEVNGQVVYASSRLLATSMDYKEQEKPTPENPEAGRRFTAASGKVKAKDGRTNLRTLPTTEPPSEVAAQLTGEETAERLAVDADKGWTKLSYNGQIVYAVTNYLTAVEG